MWFKIYIDDPYVSINYVDLKEVLIWEKNYILACILAKKIFGNRLAGIEDKV